MVNQDIIEKLRSLTSRQKDVLKGVCEGKPYKEIAKELFLSIETIKTHMGNVYIKLGLTHLPPTLRKKIILDEYCPALKEFDYPESVIYQDVPEDTEEPEPVPDEVGDMVDEDEKALIVVEPKVIIIPAREKKDKRKKKRRVWRWILFIVIIALLVFGGMQVYSWARGFINDVVVPMVAQETPELIPTQEYVQPTPQPAIIPTEEVVIVPTNTSLPPTPQPTQTPSPIISLPFVDDFSNGINSPWSVESGNWFVTDSGASISINDIYADAGAIVIDDPTLTNYKLRVRVHTPHMFAASQGQFGVVVRYSSDKDQNIILYMDSNARFKWAYIESLNDLSFYQPPITGVDKRDLGSTDVTVEIEVSGNTFIARVDGAKVDQFSMTGYENGGIALITSCGSIGSCPSFSNLSIEPVN
jgi:hypothetical protein